MIARHFFTMAAVVSAVMLASAIVLWTGVFNLDPPEDEYRLSITNSFHISVMQGRLWFFNDRWPYHGSSLCSADQPIREIAFGDAFGIYFRHFYFPKTNQTLWTLAISLFYPAVAFSILPAMWGLRRRRRSSSQPPNG